MPIKPTRNSNRLLKGLIIVTTIFNNFSSFGLSKAEEDTGFRHTIPVGDISRRTLSDGSSLLAQLSFEPLLWINSTHSLSGGANNLENELLCRKKYRKLSGGLVSADTQSACQYLREWLAVHGSSNSDDSADSYDLLENEMQDECKKHYLELSSGPSTGTPPPPTTPPTAVSPAPTNYCQLLDQYLIDYYEGQRELGPTLSTTANNVGISNSFSAGEHELMSAIDAAEKDGGGDLQKPPLPIVVLLNGTEDTAKIQIKVKPNSSQTTGAAAVNEKIDPISENPSLLLQNLPMLVSNLPPLPSPQPLRMACRDPPTQSGHCKGLSDDDMAFSRIQIYVWKAFRCQSVLWRGCSPRTRNFFYRIEDCMKSCNQELEIAGTGHGKYDDPEGANVLSPRMALIEDSSKRMKKRCLDVPAETVPEDCKPGLVRAVFTFKEGACKYLAMAECDETMKKNDQIRRRTKNIFENLLSCEKACLKD